jgi:DNA-binding IclR family transcriptional regulator
MRPEPRRVQSVDSPLDLLEALVPAGRRSDGLEARTPTTITEPEVFLVELERVRVQGHGVDEQEHEWGVRCVAVAVGPPDRVVAALSVSGPADRFSGVATGGLLQAMRRAGEDLAAG